MGVGDDTAKQRKVLCGFYSLRFTLRFDSKYKKKIIYLRVFKKFRIL